MLIKQKDDLQPTVAMLEGLLALKNLSGKQRERIEEELDHVRAGARGEKEAAYHIDFQLKDARNYAVIHDLRLEHNGRVAQIDHLLIGRMFDVFVIESKNVTTALRVNPDHEFEVKTRWGWKGMASPVEQNKRHIRVLSDLIDDEKTHPDASGDAYPSHVPQLGAHPAGMQPVQATRQRSHHPQDGYVRPGFGAAYQPQSRG